MRLSACLAFLLIGTGAALAKECRIPDLPPGMRVQLPPHCKEPTRMGRTQSAKQDRLRGDDGFVEIGDGTRVRIGGRVRTEFGIRR